MMSDRKAFEAEIINWLIGIRDHTDNDVEYVLLGALIDDVEEGLYRDEPASADRSGEADETPESGSAGGESAVTAKPADAQIPIRMVPIDPRYSPTRNDY